jgi:hypothetical protein
MDTGMVWLATGADSTRLSVEIGSTPAQTQIGLMHRDTLPPDEGMLFLFLEPRPPKVTYSAALEVNVGFSRLIQNVIGQREERIAFESRAAGPVLPPDAVAIRRAGWRDELSTTQYWMLIS